MTSIGKITSIANYSNYFDYGFQDVAGIDCYCYDQMGKGHGWQESEELRDVFHPIKSVEVLVGAFEQIWGYTNLGLGWPAFVSPDIESTNYNNELSTNVSGFSQIYWNVTDRLRLQGGVRVSWDRVRMTRSDFNYNQPAGTNPYLGLNNLIGATQLPPGADAPSTGEKSWVNFGGKFGADYRVLDNVMTYGYYARGFKSGGFNGRVTISIDIGPYNPETVDSFEVGLKSDWLEKRVQINLAAFLNKWSDMQVNQVLYRGNPPVGSSTILNAGKATTEGVELESSCHSGAFALGRPPAICTRCTINSCPAQDRPARPSQPRSRLDAAPTIVGDLSPMLPSGRPVFPPTTPGACSAATPKPPFSTASTVHDGGTTPRRQPNF